MNIKPIETVYNGYRFRSRLEARWAVFFDEAGIEYQYEPEGFDLGDGLYYLPDFYLPEEDTWVEIKGQALTPKEREKIERFCLAKCECDTSHNGSRFKLLEGQIPNYYIKAKNGSLGIPCFNYLSPSTFVKAMKKLSNVNVIEPSRGVLIGSIWIPDRNYETVDAALDKARQVRFEHGETPKIRR